MSFVFDLSKNWAHAERNLDDFNMHYFQAKRTCYMTYTQNISTGAVAQIMNAFVNEKGQHA